MIIQHNIMAINSHRQLGVNNSNLGENLQKLSSGYRINKAADDAAGLAISEKMRAQITGLDRAVLNAQDGASLIQTAEGALSEVHSMLNRMVELATQSANGTIQDVDRGKIEDELNALKDEIDRISQATNFNGIQLLDGSLQTPQQVVEFDTLASGTAVATGAKSYGAAQLFTPEGVIPEGEGGDLKFTASENKIEVSFTNDAGSVSTRTITLATEGIKTMAGATNAFRMVDDTGAVWGTVTLKNDAAITDVNTFVEDVAAGLASNIKSGGTAMNSGTGAATTLDIHAKNTSGLGLKMQVGDTAATYNQIEVSVDDMSTTGLNIKDISMGTQEAAAKALDSVKNAIEQVSSNRGKLGALQNRLTHTINNLGVTSENMTAAESRIRDVDMAKEMMAFTKNNVLGQAAQSMLAQANMQPQNVLQLLR